MAKTKNELMIPDEVVLNKIYLIRGQKVMLDRDLAELYGVKPIRLREQVKRNIIRFPENFMLQLTDEEVETMVSQNAIPSKQHLGGYLPYAFTEHGVLMLANVLQSDQAIQMSIRIIEIFVKMREMILANKDILLKLEQIEHKLLQHDDEIQIIFDHIKLLLNPHSKKEIRLALKPEAIKRDHQRKNKYIYSTEATRKNPPHSAPQVKRCSLHQRNTKRYANPAQHIFMKCLFFKV